MTIFLSHEGDTVVVRFGTIQAHGLGTLYADGWADVNPGEAFQGIPYAELRAMGPGRHDVEEGRNAVSN